MDNNAHFADVDAVRQYASTLNQQQLQCRDFGHNWRPHTAARRSDGGYDRSLICRCRTLRIQVLDQLGKVISSQYAYPDGYEMPRGIGRISSDDKGVLRLASIEHTLQAADAKTAKRASMKKSSTKNASPRTAKRTASSRASSTRKAAPKRKAAS